MSEIETVLQQRPGTRVVTSLRIEVVDGPDRGRHIVANDTVSIGTAGDNALVLTDFTVSRYHLEVTVNPVGIVVTDLGSKNGSYVGAVRIERAVVPPGTQVTLGGTTIRFDDAVRQTVPTSNEVRSYAGMIARAPQMLQLFATVDRVASAPTSVLIVGESGTGKEGVAEALHVASGRANEPLVTVDCGALSSALLASELFGHERGAFTGAERTHVGAFERAAGGTVFLDEIGELPASDQVALLGVLERRRFRRVGGTQDVELRARIVAATNRDLRAEVNNGRFRHDLYHRLAIVVLRLPPLRDRREDIAPLIERFAAELGATGPIEQTFGAETIARWLKHPWPGNVRELRNAVEAALVVGPSGNAAFAPSDDDAALLPYKDARAAVVRDFEYAYLKRLLEEAGGNVSRAARTAKMDRSHLIDLLERHGLKE